MPIEYRQGCLIKALKSGEVEAIGHQANCQNTMNSGVAKAIRESFPAAYEADQQTKKGDQLKLGSLSWVIVPIYHPVNHAGMIFNLYGQFYYGREKGKVYTDLPALEASMKTMKLFTDSAEVSSIGFPKLGAGLGGAAWEDVEDIIIRTFTDDFVIVYLN